MAEFRQKVKNEEYEEKEQRNGLGNERNMLNPGC